MVAAQCPQWTGLSVTPLPDEVEGTDHVLFRIGGELVARMPKIGWAVGQAESDARWLPVLASHLPARIPVPLHLGRPGAGYPWRWTVVPWIGGSTPPRQGSADIALARDLAAFARALHAVDPSGGRSQARETYREAMGYDGATWRRACGWALAPALTGLDYYRHTFPRMAEGCRRMIRAVIAELAVNPAGRRR
ncbi:Aminoglycoside phosphotransferase [Couchioplanes caeruleus subsp. caeruleus]|uniref:Aminoglycoside phosphotransferase n=1 Tax=Couchioplanes caeruleus subsp. caeruleus TaxID=56427 RepID=A0A1K0FU37_9ACTN|nr:Aminoglycoside phosphotransferase [Couchioplanes caeruleus subsp. caeruleus]